jgi:hypothetical protein
MKRAAICGARAHACRVETRLDTFSRLRKIFAGRRHECRRGTPRGARHQGNQHLCEWVTGCGEKSRYFPTAVARYCAIALTSASDACAPRVTIFSTMAVHSASFIRWLVTTSTA